MTSIIAACYNHHGMPAKLKLVKPTVQTQHLRAEGGSEVLGKHRTLYYLDQENLEDHSAVCCDGLID